MVSPFEPAPRKVPLTRFLVVWVGGLVVWWFGGLVVWWFGGLVVWWFGGCPVFWAKGKRRNFLTTNPSCMFVEGTLVFKGNRHFL